MPAFLRWILRQGPANPIAVRLVQNGSRRSRHLYIRASYLAVLIVTLLWLLLLNAGQGALTYRQLAGAGASAFTWIAYLQVLLICVLAPVFMGGAIAQEASPRTWEVLLTTPLTSAEIVLGNLFGRLFFVLALLVASLPLFALTQYYGGVPGTAVFASYLVAGCAALLVGALAIALSVSRLVGKRAFFVFYVCIVSYLGVTLAVDRFMVGSNMGQSGGSGVTYMTALNPFLALHALLNPTTYPTAPAGQYEGLRAWMLESPVKFWCIGSALLSALFMGLSVFTVRTGGLHMVGSDESGVPFLQRLRGRKPSEQGGHRAPKHVWANPIAWREAASRNSSAGKIIARYAFLASGLVFALVLLWLYHSGSMSHAAFQFAIVATVWGELAVISLVAINTAATAISKEREDGTLDLLLTTPLTASAYLMGKLRGLVTYLLPLLIVPIGTLLFVGAYVLFGGFGRAGGVDVSVTIGGAARPIPVVLPEIGLIVTLVTIPFMAFCVMVGLQWSLKSKGTLGSVVGAVGVVGAIAAVVGLCGWQASPLSALSPVTAVSAGASPDTALAGVMDQLGPAGARLVLVVGAAVSALIHGGVCYGIHTSMVRTFDMTVRKLAGNK